MKILSINDIKKSLLKSILSILIFLLSLTSVIVFFTQIKYYEKNKQLESEQIRMAINSYKSALSNNLSIVASTDNFLDYIRSGDITRKRLYPSFLLQISSIKFPGLSGLEISKDKTFFNYGNPTNYSVDLKLCYLNRSLDSTMGTCDFFLKLYFDEKEILKYLETTNGIFYCPNCSKYNFLNGKQFGDFDIDKNTNLYIGFRTNSSPIDYLYVYIVLVSSLILFGFFSWRKFKKNIDKYLDLPLKKLADALQRNKKIIMNDEEIDEIKYLSAQIENWRYKVQELEKAESSIKLGKLALQVAHDIRSPLAALKTITIDIHQIPEDQRNIIKNALVRINDVANNLLNEYKHDKDEALIKAQVVSEPIYLIIDSIISEKRAQFLEKKVSIEYLVEDSANFLCAKINSIDFKRVLSNLINNAVESINENVLGKVEIKLFKNFHFIRIEIRDNGRGIPQDLLTKVVEGGVSIGKKGGSGLGISYAIKSINEWGGDYDIYSKVDEGTKFGINLPQCDPPIWLLNKLIIPQNSVIYVLDDDKLIHDVWHKRFTNNMAIKEIKSFYHTEDLILENRHDELNNKFYLIDYEIYNSPINGLDVIEKIGISDLQGALVTSQYDDMDVKARCINIGIKILPKIYASNIPIQILSESQERNNKIVFIDNEDSITLAWRIRASVVGKNLDTFVCVENFIKKVNEYGINTVFYIDLELGHRLNGIDLAKFLYEKGYRNIYIATGHPKNYFGDILWVKDIVGKEPPF